MGLPPSLGFFSKLLVYLQIFENSNPLVLLVLLMLTPISGFGYLRLLLSLLVSRGNKSLVETRAVSGVCGFFTGWETVLFVFVTPMFIVFLPLLQFIAVAVGGPHMNFDFAFQHTTYGVLSHLLVSLVETLVGYSLCVLAYFQWLV